eukprot:365336-Chlamydomonas_euryale.AAC.14
MDDGCGGGERVGRWAPVDTSRQRTLPQLCGKAICEKTLQTQPQVTAPPASAQPQVTAPPASAQPRVTAPPASAQPQVTAPLASAPPYMLACTRM